MEGKMVTTSESYAKEFRPVIRNKYDIMGLYAKQQRLKQTPVKIFQVATDKPRLE